MSKAKLPILVILLIVAAGITILALIAASENAKSTIITLTAEGRLTRPPAALSSVFSAGDRAVFKLVYDTDAPNTNSTSNAGVYAALSFSVTIDSYVASAPTGEINVVDNTVNAHPIDFFRVASFSTSDELVGDPVDGLALERIAFQLFDNDGIAFTSDSLPTEFLPITDFENVIFRVDFANQANLTGRLDTLSVEHDTYIEQALKRLIPIN